MMKVPVRWEVPQGLLEGDKFGGSKKSPADVLEMSGRSVDLMNEICDKATLTRARLSSIKKRGLKNKMLK